MFALSDLDESSDEAKRLTIGRAVAVATRSLPLQDEFQRGRDLRESGELTASRDLLRLVLHERERELGLDDDETQVAASQLGRTLRAMKEFDAAVSLHERVLTFRLRHYGHAHSFTQNSVRILADTYRMAGRDHQATALERRHRKSQVP